jgi:hypothetical protein
MIQIGTVSMSNEQLEARMETIAPLLEQCASLMIPSAQVLINGQVGIMIVATPGPNNKGSQCVALYDHTLSDEDILGILDGLAIDIKEQP